MLDWLYNTYCICLLLISVRKSSDSILVEIVLYMNIFNEWCQMIKSDDVWWCLMIIMRDLFLLISKMFVTKEIEIHTKRPFDIIDLTDQIKSFLKKCKAKDWLVSIFTRHTTAVLKINEAEDGFWNDLRKRCDKYVSIDERYQHNDLENRDPKTMCKSKEECLNGHSHIRAMLMWDSSETVPVKKWNMLLGVWQRILLFELDHARSRQIVFSYMGE